MVYIKQHHPKQHHLNWDGGNPLSPTKSLTPPCHTHFLFLRPPSHQSVGLVACSCIVLDLGSNRPDGGVLVWPADSRFNQRPRIQGDGYEQFFSFCPLFKTAFLVLCQGWSSGGDQRASREAERAPQAGQSIFLEMALKWECWVLWWMWSETFSGKKMLCYSRSPHVESCRYTEPVCDSFSNLWSRDVIHACLILFVQTERCVWSSGAVQDHNLPQKRGKISLRLAQWRNHKVISLKSWLSVQFKSDRPRSLSEYMCNHLI